MRQARSSPLAGEVRRGVGAIKTKSRIAEANPAPSPSRKGRGAGWFSFFQDSRPAYEGFQISLQTKRAPCGALWVFWKRRP